jgi:hypothetical protein
VTIEEQLEDVQKRLQRLHELNEAHSESWNQLKDTRDSAIDAAARLAVDLRAVRENNPTLSFPYVNVGVDDLDDHDESCKCVNCNNQGRSWGASVYPCRVYTVVHADCNEQILPKGNGSQGYFTEVDANAVLEQFLDTVDCNGILREDLYIEHTEHDEPLFRVYAGSEELAQRRAGRLCRQKGWIIKPF